MIKLGVASADRRLRIMGDSIVRKNNLVVTAMLTVCVGAICCVGGCSQSKERQGGKDLLAAVDRSGKLYRRALGLLRDPVYRIGKQYAPIRHEEGKEPDAIVLGPPDEMHPEVLGALSEAERILSTALRDNADAEPGDRAIAQTLLGQVQSLIGYCHSWMSYRAMDSLAKARAQAHAAIATAALRVNLLEYHKKLQALGEDELGRLRANAVAMQSAKAAELKRHSDQIGALKAEQARQNKAYEKFNAQARAMRMERGPASGQKRLDTLNNAQKIQVKADAAETKAAEIENKLGSLNVKRKALELERDAAKARIRVIDEMLKERQAQAAANEDNRKEILKRLEADQAALRKLLGRMVRDCERISQAQSKAVRVYELASNQLRAADRAPGVNTAARQADVLIAVAGLDVRCLAALAKNKDLAGKLADLWAKVGAGKLPDDGEKIQSFLAESETLREDAEAKYDEAVKLCRKAIRSVDRQYQWVYQGQLASAYMGLYALTGSAETRAEAQTAINDALANKESSPNLEAVKRLQKVLEAEQR